MLRVLIINNVLIILSSRIDTLLTQNSGLGGNIKTAQADFPNPIKMDTTSNQESQNSPPPTKPSFGDSIIKILTGVSLVFACIYVVVPREYFHDCFIKPQIKSSYVSWLSEDNHNIKSIIKIWNDGNKREESLQVSVTMVDGSEIGISNVLSLDTTQRTHQYGLKEVIIKHDHFLRDDTLTLTFNTNRVLLDSFQTRLKRYGIDYYSFEQPNISYIKGSDRQYRKPSFKSPKLD